MKHISALVIKFVMVTAILYIVLGLFYGVLFTNILWTSLMLTLWAYLLGDLLVLPFAGNITAMAADFGLAFLCIWIMGVYTFPPDVSVVSATFFAAIGITIAEGFFHNYMKKQVLDLPEQRKIQ